jgi:hypothetical protein
MKQQDWYPDGDMLVNESRTPQTPKRRFRSSGIVGKTYGLSLRSMRNPNVLLLVDVYVVQHGRREFYTRVALGRIIFADSDHENEIVRAGTFATVPPERHVNEEGAAASAFRLASDYHCGTRSPSDWDGTERGFPADGEVLRLCCECIVFVPDGERHTCTDEDRRRRSRAS